MKNRPLVSVIMPTKNRIDLLKNALESIYNQTYKNTEIIIIDDGSDDGTHEFLKKESESKGIKFILNDSPGGAGKARNIGIKEARGEIIAFLDDDDEWLPEKLEKQVVVFEDEEIGLVYTGSQLINTDQDLSYLILPTIKGRVFEELLIENRIGSTASVAVRGEIAKELLFDEDFSAREEYDLWLRIAKNYKINGVREPLVNVYSRNSLSRITSDVNNYVKAIDIINRKYKAEIDSLPKDKQRERAAEQRFFLASQAVKANNLKLARRYYRKSFATKITIKSLGGWVASFFGIKALLQLRKLKG